MPARNTIREFANENYYHVYNRGVGKQTIFLDDQDYGYFLGLLKRYLLNRVEKRPTHAAYSSYYNDVELLAFCLMPNHFHLYLYQTGDDGVERLMKSVSVAYSMYFNKRYNRVGALYQQRYRAARITTDAYYYHISRYIHLNPDDYMSWNWSSLPYYLGTKHADWVRPRRVLQGIDGDYRVYVDAYKDRRDELKKMDKLLAD